MEYNIKKENRKKFQDKSKLKRHHKKDYSKVIPKQQLNDTEASNQENEDETEYEDVTDPEIDHDGNYVLKEDEIEEINDEGQKIVRRKKIDKVNSNAWRYREEIEVLGLDQDEEEMLKSIDFKKLDFNTIDFKKDRSHKDFKKMTNDELLNLEIIDEKYDSKHPSTSSKTAKSDEDQLDELFKFTNRASNKSSHSHNQPPNPLSTNKTPAQLKSDESFLDDLI